MDNGAPNGVSFDFNGKRYDLLPNVFCGANVRIVQRVASMKRKQDLQEVFEIVRGTPEAAMVVKELVAADKPIKNLLTAMVDPDCIVVIVTRSCPQVSTERDPEGAARELVDAYPSYPELLALIARAADFEKLKNFASQILPRHLQADLESTLAAKSSAA